MQHLRNFFICRYFSFNEQLKFHAQLIWAWKKFYNLIYQRFIAGWWAGWIMPSPDFINSHSQVCNPGSKGPLVFQSNITQLFIIRLSSKIAQLFPLHFTNGHSTSDQLVQIHKYFSSIKSLLLYVLYIDFYQSCTNDSILLNKNASRAKYSEVYYFLWKKAFSITDYRDIFFSSLAVFGKPQPDLNIRPFQHKTLSTHPQ